MSLPPVPFKAKTIVSWAGEQDGDLGFMENEVIDVFSIVDDAWWSGKLRRNKNEGIFPKDYVKVLASSSTPSKQNTPVKEDYRSSDYRSSDYRSSDYRSSDFRSSNDPRNSRNTTPVKKKPVKHVANDSYDEFSFDNSYDDLTRVNGRSKKSPFKTDDQFKLQQQNARSSMVESPSYKSRTNGSKFRPHSSYTRQSSTPNFRSLNSPGYEFANHTVESFSPEASPKAAAKKRHTYQDVVEPRDELDDIVMKKRQLELELLKLEELQKSTLQKRSTRSPFKHKEFEHSNDSYVSEDLNSSKKNFYSREDLSKKLSLYPTDDDYHDYDYDYEYGVESSPPPPPPKHQSPLRYGGPDEELSQGKIPYDADDFKFSGNGKVMLTEEEFMRLSQVQQEELKNSIKSLQSDVLNLSELSATSAGSFLRHKFEKEFMAEQELKFKRLSINNDSNVATLNGQSKADDNLMESIFQDKKSRHPNIFKKLLKKKEEVTNPLEQRMQEDEGRREIDWTTFKLELNRMNTLTSDDKRERTRRVLREEFSVIVKPFDYVSDINTNEFIGDQYHPLMLNKGQFESVDLFASRYEVDYDLNSIISDIGVKFSTSRINQIRAVLIHFIKFNIIEESGKIQQTKPKLNEILLKGEGSIYQLNYLFKKVLDALRIPSEVVLGFWKKPNEFYHNEQYIINHSWLSVLVEDQFLIVDLLNFKDLTVCNIRNESFNEFYFLAKPLTLISTHIPSVIDLQHVIPPIEQNVAFYLPRLYSGYYQNQLSLKNFNNCLTRLKDLELFEVDIEISVDVELFTLIKTSKVTTNEFTLCQVYWNNNKRYAKIKAILPENEEIGVLQIFSGPKGMQKHFNNIHELSVVIPIYHQGDCKPIKFVPRYPTVQSQNNDLYVKSPQTSKIIIKNSYNFDVLQYPSRGINNSSKILNQDFKIVIESPSGKYFKLVKSDPNKPYGSFESLIKCQELGLYRGLVIGDSGTSWYVFAQWECIPGTVT